jgi:hypothetical protein
MFYKSDNHLWASSDVAYSSEGDTSFLELVGEVASLLSTYPHIPVVKNMKIYSALYVSEIISAHLK